MAAAPYPADTRAKGWRFELDLERVRQSDTWALASADVRPWLLMLWCTAWEQTPCGSLPADDALIAARIGMAPKAFAKCRDVLLRGWWLADDGRLYNPTITARVMEMQEYRAKQAKRVADHKAKMREQRTANALPTHEQPVSNDTGTGTGTSIGNTEDHPHLAGGRAHEAAEPVNAKPTQAGALCRELRLVGIQDVNPGHPRLLALLEAGAAPQEFTGFARTAVEAGKGFAWVLGAVEGERRRAAAMAGQLHRGPMPNRQEAQEQRNAAVGDDWLVEQGAA